MISDGSLPPILYFGNDWSAENRTSSHQIARWLARRHRVCYVECPGLRAPKSTGRDLTKIFAKLARFFRPTRQVEENLRVATLVQIPLHRFAAVRWLNARLLLWSLRWLMWREGIRKPISWFMIPHLATVMKRLGERLAVYYCIDDYSALPDVNPEAVQLMDQESTRTADLVFVASATLLEQKRQLNPATLLSPHGVDFDHFAQAQDESLPMPVELRSLPRPMIGFFGLIEQWIDLELVGWLAERRPQWSFVMIGRAAVPAEQLPKHPNVHFLGKRPYSELPKYGRQFDVAIIPYRLNKQVYHANPIKLREYLAMGKPIVSVSTPEIDKYADVVAVAQSREEYLAKLDAALANPSSSMETRMRMQRVAAESWDSRLCQVFEAVTQRLDPSTSVLSPAPCLQ